MIDSLQGVLLHAVPGEAVIQCGGVGYLVHTPVGTVGALPSTGEEAMLYTHLAVGENDISLFGFATQDERRMFGLLTGVSGVGPKVGLAILSALSADQIVLAVSAGDHKAFTAASGVGPKLAQRLVLELKDKVAKGFDTGGLSLQGVAAATSGAAGGSAQAIAALASLGYTQSEAAAAVAQIDPGLPVAEIIRLALQGLGRGR